MTRILLATENFPFGKGEKSFILPELARLAKEYDVTVISHADAGQLAEGQSVELPPGVRLVLHPRPQLTAFDKGKALVRFLADRDGRQEIREILREGEHRGMRLYQSLSFYAQTLAEQKRLARSGTLFVQGRAGERSGLSEEETVIYYSFWYDYYCYSMVREKKKHPKLRMITRTHGRDLYHGRIPGGRLPFRWQMEEGLDGILFACDYGRDYYDRCVRGENFPAGRLHVCRLGTESAARFMPPHGDGPWQFVSCSHVIPLKRVERIIDGLALVDGLSVCWTHIGDGESMEAVKAYAREKLGAKPNIDYVFTGFLERADVWYQENQVDCFITTSATEGGCPVSIQEAMSYGIPVIGTDVGGITEMIAGNGLLLSEDPCAAEVAEAISRICTAQPEEMMGMKEKSLSLWREMFDIGSCYDRLRGILGRPESGRLT